MTLGRRSQILLVDDDASTIHLLGRMLSSEGDIRFTTSASEALSLVDEMMASGAPDLILLDIDMPGKNGLEICRTLQSDTRLSQVPVIILTSHAQPATEVWALELGAADFIAKPLVNSQVLARVRAQLRPRADRLADAPGGPPRILIVDDDAGAIQCVRLALGSSAAQFHFARDGEEALQVALKTHPDIIVLDGQMPGIDGFEVCRRLQDNAALAHIPVVFVTRFDEPDQEARAMALGACDFISKPYKPSVLNARVRSLLRRRARTAAGGRPALAPTAAPPPPAQLPTPESAEGGALAAPSPSLHAIVQELGDPLHGLLGCAQLMLADPEHPLHPVQVRRLDRIIDASRELQRVMRDVSDLGQLANRTLELHLETVDALDSLQEALRQTEADSTARGIQLSLGALPPSTLVRGDRARLRQAFVNLLGLLFKGGGPAPRHIEFRFEMTGTRLRISAVEPNLAPAQARRLPLSAQQQASREALPHGGELNWSLSWQLVHAMGGRLKVSSMANGPQGDLFELMLPAVPNDRPVTRQ